MPGGAAPRRKGQRAEQTLVRLLREAGLNCQRVPLSGAAGGHFGGDLVLALGSRLYRVEVKVRRQGFVKLYAAVRGTQVPTVLVFSNRTRQLVRWLEHTSWLFLRADRMPWLVVWRAGRATLAVQPLSGWLEWTAPQEEEHGRQRGLRR